MDWKHPPDINVDDNLIIDVRSPAEYDAAHIPHSYNIPLNRIEEYLDVLRHLDDAVLICRTDNRSSQAWKTLKGVGASVSVLKKWDSRMAG